MKLSDNENTVFEKIVSGDSAQQIPLQIKINSPKCVIKEGIDLSAKSKVELECNSANVKKITGGDNENTLTLNNSRWTDLELSKIKDLDISQVSVSISKNSSNEFGNITIANSS